MPNIVNGDSTGIDVIQNSYEYTYPLGNDFRPGSAKHSEVLTKILNRIRDAKTEIQKRYGVWDKITQKLNTYVVMDPEERKLHAQDPQKPVAVVIPMLYSNLDTILTYWLTAFGDGPLFKYRGIGPEDRAKAMLLELLIDAQSQRMKTLLNLYVQWRDAIAYGLGIVNVTWATEYGNKTNTVPYGFTSDLFGNFVQVGSKNVTTRELLWEANKLENVHPKRYFPDPSVACHNVQDMEFLGLLLPTNYMKLLDLERNDPSTWFNVRYLRGKKMNSEFNTEGARTSGVEARTDLSHMLAQPVDLLHVPMTIIPKEWKLGKNEYPEKWLFTIAGDKVIVRAQPMNLNHNRYTVSVCCPSFDGYSVAPVSILETGYEAQVAADFYYKTRIHNLLSMVNNRGIIDPYLARYDDAINTSPGSWIRIREHVWGRGVENAVASLPAPDYTQSYLQEIDYLANLTKATTGAVDSLQGVVRPSGERRSATEMRDTRMSAVSRVQKSCRLASQQSMIDIGYMFGYHVKQFMTRNAIVQLAGDNIAELMQIYGNQAQGGYLPITPDMMNLDFDVLASDGVTPGGEYLPDMINLFRETQSNPVTSQTFDATKQALDLYARSGVKGATRLLKVQVAGPQQMDQVLSDPNAVPVLNSAISSSGIGPNVPTEAFNQ